jgi:DNA-binding CsgD family transcriptional regulator
MKRTVLNFLLFLAFLPLEAYNDHRGHNLDSLERVVARWTPDAVDRASEQELLELNRAYRDLMLGYAVINGEKCIFYGRKALSISRSRGWEEANADAYRNIGQQYYGREQYDSAMVYYQAALASVEKMASGATSPLRPEGYSQLDVDDARSALYGTIGNLYNMMGDVPQAMEWYAKAGEIFEQYGWNESNSVLHYNMGETWVDEGELKKARKEYDRAMEYAQASGDSLIMVEVWKGYGRLYMEQGRTWKSLPYLRKADAYYAAHPDYAPTFRTENLDYMKEVLGRQKRQLGILAGALVALALIAAGVVVGRKKGKEEKKTSSIEPAPVAATAPELTSRDKEILDLLAKGYTATQIAEALSLSPETIRWYRKRLLEKFDVANTPELIFQARELGVI